MNRYFTKEDVWMTNKPTKRCSTSLTSRKMLIKVMMNYHYISLEQLKKKMARKNQPWANQGEEHSRERKVRCKGYPGRKKHVCASQTSEKSSGMR